MSLAGSRAPVVLAAVAHPDDIEFCFAGTLLLLKEAGCEIHMWNLANGSCGTMEYDRETIIKMRGEEAREAAALAGATAHAPLFDDLAVFYDQPSLAAVSAVVREIRPQIVLTHSPQDYMEDHQNVCRLVVTAAFSRSMTNFSTAPARDPYQDPVRVYHASPHGLMEGLETLFRPSHMVEIASVLETKGRMLSCHRSQKNWLEASQGMGAYVREMEGMGRAMAEMASGFSAAEGWRRHSHIGFCSADYDPLTTLLPNHCKTLNV